MNQHHAVYQFLKRRLKALDEEYLAEPNELNRNRLACHEEVIRRWEIDHQLVGEPM